MEADSTQWCVHQVAPPNIVYEWGRLSSIRVSASMNLLIGVRSTIRFNLCAPVQAVAAAAYKGESVGVAEVGTISICFLCQ